MSVVTETPWTISEVATTASVTPMFIAFPTAYPMIVWGRCTVQAATSISANAVAYTAHDTTCASTGSIHGSAENVPLLEQGKLTCGTTWHAAGLMTAVAAAASVRFASSGSTYSAPGNAAARSRRCRPRSRAASRS